MDRLVSSKLPFVVETYVLSGKAQNIVVSTIDDDDHNIAHYLA
jgi:hypothetical protein